jgi:hypothetical protein
VGLRKASTVGAVLLALGGVTEAQSVGPGQGPWLFDLSVRETYDTNVRFRSDPDPDDFVTSLNARLSRAFLGTRNDVSLAATVGRLWYLDRENLNRWTFTGGVNLVSRLSPRAQLTVADGYSTNYTDQIANLAQDGTVLPQSSVQRNRARVGLSLGLSTTTSLDLTAAHDLYYYSDPTLVDGKRFVAGTILSRRFSPNRTGSFSYDLQRNNRGGGLSFVHTASLGWSQAVGSRAQLGLSGGVSYVDTSDLSAVHPVGTASLNVLFQRGSFGLNYEHRLRQNFGLGRETTDSVVSANLLRQLGARFSFDVGYTYVHSTDALDPSAKLDSQSAQAGVRFAASPRLSLFAGYVYQRRTQPSDAGDQIVSAQRPTIQGSYSVGW